MEGKPARKNKTKALDAQDMFADFKTQLESSNNLLDQQSSELRSKQEEVNDYLTQKKLYSEAKKEASRIMYLKFKEENNIGVGEVNDAEFLGE